MMGAVAYRFRAELRSRWRAWIGLGLIVGLIAGAVILLAAGSRRTSTAYDRFLAAQHAYDVGVLVQCKPAGRPGRAESAGPTRAPDQSCTDEVAKLPAVAEATGVRDYPGFVETADGTSLQPEPSDPCYSGPGQVSLIGDPTGRFGTSLNESRIVAGRRADPSVAEETVISKDTADRLGLGPGDTLRVQLFAGADCQDAPSKWHKAQQLRIVGVGLAPGEVAPPAGLYFTTLNLTPAFTRGAGASPGTFTPYLMVRLEQGATTADLQREAKRAGYRVLPVLSAREQADLLRDATRPVAVSLALIAALVALAGVAVLGQVLVRQAYLDSSDRGTLAALGLTRARQLALGMLRAGFVGALGAGVAVVVAVAASPLMPLGLARDVEPSAGLSVDAAAIALGFFGTLLFVFIVSALAAWRLAGRATVVGEGNRRRSRATVATAMAQRGVRPVPVSGVRFALDRGWGTRAVPVWSSMLGLVVAATTLVGAATFGAGLTHLVDTPRLLGWNWDVVAGISGPDRQESPAETARRNDRISARVRTVRAVNTFTTGTFWPPFPQGRRLQLGPHRVEADMLAFDPNGVVGPSVISGRSPRTADEILLGPDTLDALGLGIGDTLTAFGQAGTWEEPGKETSARMRVVGTGVIPTSSDLGQGATMTLDGLARLNQAASPDGFYVRRARGVDDRELTAALARKLGIGISQVELIGPQALDPSGKLYDLREVDDVPALLAFLMALMAAAVLAHVLVSAVRHHRRDLAMLRTLGFTRRQLVGTVRWQASTYVLITLAVSVPLGVALGRGIWRLYAESLGVVPEPATPWITIGVAVLVAFVTANLIAFGSAGRASRAAPAAILRTE